MKIIKLSDSVARALADNYRQTHFAPIMKAKHWTYRGVFIHPKNDYGMYWALCFGRSIAANTIEGMRRLIREHGTSKVSPRQH